MPDAEPLLRATSGNVSGYSWSAADPVQLPSSQISTEQDGVRRFFAWRDYLFGVLDTHDGPLGVFIRLRGGRHGAEARRAEVGERGGQASGAVVTSAPAAVSMHRPDVQVLSLKEFFEPGERPGSRESMCVEPAIVQGLALIALGTRLLAVDLFAEELAAVAVLELDGGNVFIGGVRERGQPGGDARRGKEHDLLAVVRSPDGQVLVVSIQPAVNDEGVLRLTGEWSWETSASEGAEGLFDDADPAELSRAIMTDGAVVVPGRTSVWAAAFEAYPPEAAKGGRGRFGQRPEGGWGRWVWSRQEGPVDSAARFAEGRYAWELRGESPGVLLKALDAEEEPFWVLARPDRSGRPQRRYPERELVVAGGRIFAVGRKDYGKLVQELTETGGTRGKPFAISGPAMEGLLPVGDDLVVIVRDGQVLKFWAYTPSGTPRQPGEGGQKTLGEGHAPCQPVLCGERVVCLRVDGDVLHVEVAEVKRK